MSNSTFDATGAQSDQSNDSKTIWQIDIYPADGQPNRLASDMLDSAKQLSFPDDLKINAARGFLIQENLSDQQVHQVVNELLVDNVVEQAIVNPIAAADVSYSDSDAERLVYVLPLPGVTDAVAESARAAMVEMGVEVEAVRTFRKFWISRGTTSIDSQTIERLIDKLLCNDSIEMSVAGRLKLDQLSLGQTYDFDLGAVELLAADDARLSEISKTRQLSLTLVEMKTIQQHFKMLRREPTDVELETIAQTWSEHCSHKTLAGRVNYTDENGVRKFDNMLKETIFAATEQIRADLGEQDWCVSVFKDNAGIVRFDDENNVVFKVETHNRPSALEPYGGANTGIGGVIRDTLGTGMGAKPVCSTDVFCFASPDTPYEDLPPGVMHPKMIMKGVVSGVRDYGNRMGIPTVNGAVYFDPRYIGNPLVFCGNIGLIPRDKSEKEPKPNDLIVSIGGRTGRDGIKGATFSSVELTEDSEITSGGAVQIGNAITEKMLMDVMLAARDQGLYNAVTDCGAGGFSSAVGEMGEEIGAEVWLDKAPLKYEGLSYTEIWISEAQERMVFAVPEDKWEAFRKLCESESVEATAIGQFKPTGRLKLLYGENLVADLAMEFLHDGRPPVIRDANYLSKTAELSLVQDSDVETGTLNQKLKSILGSLNVASKHWIIRQYDHEVQGGSVIKPLVGIENDGPADAAVVRPVLSSRRGLAVSCGMNPYYGDFDTYHMATSSIDEAIRNCVAVGADPARIAILDNFCWGYTDRPETLGSLVRAAIGCQDLAVKMQTPFISGKDSLNNEFSYTDGQGDRQTISIPSTLLISAMGQVPDVRRCVTMDLKRAGNVIYQVGQTGDHLGGSHWSVTGNLTSGYVPTVDAEFAKATYESLHRAINAGHVRSAHDMSEGGLAVCLAEMAFAGGLGVDVDVSTIDVVNLSDAHLTIARLFAESNTRFVVEVHPDHATEFERAMQDSHVVQIGMVTADTNVQIREADKVLVKQTCEQLKHAWRSPLDWA